MMEALGEKRGHKKVKQESESKSSNAILHSAAAMNPSLHMATSSIWKLKMIE